MLIGLTVKIDVKRVSCDNQRIMIEMGIVERGLEDQ